MYKSILVGVVVWTLGFFGGQQWEMRQGRKVEENSVVLSGPALVMPLGGAAKSAGLWKPPTQEAPIPTFPDKDVFDLEDEKSARVID